ncbi:hypothetical protein GCM10011507_06650 [Edaphobacter acidisoli]|uniref:Serine aminopeptidase S33 domain-containing protein n=1 Tax=Edaphobacter acidisoli TaxID=2040573 RepID=A0A916RL62_9BACT|nr:alpha/beta hydrolase [Edaphobacter acidisoli]GGA57977.1 hypothetical protein GCM10011507_06650 [Edaphobacter acidisoli]
MASRPQKQKKPRPQQPQPQQQHEVVDPIWLLKAIGLTIIAAAICAWITFCLLFYQGQWQLVLHPKRTTSAPQSIGGAPYDLVHFGTDSSAEPQLTGWWIPAPANARYSRSTILFLPTGDGSLADSIPTLATLHSLGINIFAFDYRGYGQSAPTHPNQQNMSHDAETAWLYLTTSRHILASDIIPYGTGIGASLAVQLAAAHGAIPGIVLDTPSGDLLDVALRDPRTHLVPAHMLFHERFPLAAPLSTLKTPKLLLWQTGNEPAAIRSASDPKITVELGQQHEEQYTQALTRFLDNM